MNICVMVSACVAARGNSALPLMQAAGLSVLILPLHACDIAALSRSSTRYLGGDRLTVVPRTRISIVQHTRINFLCGAYGMRRGDGGDAWGKQQFRELRITPRLVRGSSTRLYGNQQLLLQTLSSSVSRYVCRVIDDYKSSLLMIPKACYCIFIEGCRATI